MRRVPMVLDLHTDSSGASYVHTLQDMLIADHEAQPSRPAKTTGDGDATSATPTGRSFELPTRTELYDLVGELTYEASS